jgi:ribose transport system permease protein
VSSAQTERDPASEGNALIGRLRGGRISPPAPQWGNYAVVCVMLILIGIFSLTNSSTFPTVSNFQIIAGSNSITLVLALASLPPLIGGDFDLSVGYTLEIGSVVMAWLTYRFGVNIWLAIFLTLAVGAFIGMVNGLLVTKVGVSSFIATIGVGSVLSGISLQITNGAVIINGLPQSLLNFAQTNSAGIPNVTWVAAGVVIVFWLVFEHTPYGRRLLAIGLSRRSTELLGMRVGAMRASAFVIAGVMSAFAGILQLGRVGSASSGIGPDFLLPAVAAAFLGATTIKIGRFNVLGTVVAVILVAVGVSGLELNGIASWVQPIYDGGVLVIAVGSSALLTRRAMRA